MAPSILSLISLTHSHTHIARRSLSLSLSTSLFLSLSLLRRFAQGHRAHDNVRRALGLWMKDRVNHISHVLVIRKREVPRTRRIESALGERRAMWEKGVRTGRLDG